MSWIVPLNIKYMIISTEEKTLVYSVIMDILLKANENFTKKVSDSDVEKYFHKFKSSLLLCKNTI